jgi:hypothetical protein
MNTTLTEPWPETGLSQLNTVPLDAVHQSMWETAKQGCSGPAAVRQRLLHEGRSLLALAQISGRLQIHWLDLTEGLRAKVELEAPVPFMVDPSGPLQVGTSATLGVLYPAKAIFLPLPGYAFIRILQPRGVWLSNVAPDSAANRDQPLCLGTHLPGGIPLRDIMLMTYGSLTLTTTLLDTGDPAGLLNPAAAEWWQRNTGRIPLTREPFIRQK